MTLDDLGPRLCILGPSNSGKSTLAHAIAAARGVPVVHLDQLHHRPHSDYRPRPAAEFEALHTAALARERWVIEGNYTRLLDERLARATGLILLDLPMPVSLWRYARRTWFERDRKGAVAGVREQLRWAMIHHIAIITPRNRRRYRRIVEGLAMPTLQLRSRRALQRFYAYEGLAR